jgi:serine/threonine protein kinase
MLTGRHAVVADFGVARAVSQATDSSTLTSLGVALGTPAYMAPEQAVADPHVDQRADIYALGVVAYELLAGRTPFTSGSPQQMLAAQVTEKPDPPSRHRPGISPALEQALMRCLEKRAADRFQTADELLAVLEPLATPSGGTAPTSAQLPAAIPAPAPLRRPWIAGGVVVVGLAALLGWWLARDEAPVLEIGRSIHLTSDQGLEIHPDISPDGKLVAYAAGNFARMRIYIRPVAGGRSIPLSDDSTAIEADLAGHLTVRNPLPGAWRSIGRTCTRWSVATPGTSFGQG